MNSKIFTKENLPLDNEMLDFWNKNGFLVINNFYTDSECDDLIKRSQYLIQKNDFTNSSSIFDTISQTHNDDSYFLESGDKIRFFFEEKANLDDINIRSKKLYIVNKIGHALHDLDEVFHEFSHRKELDDIAKSIGFKNPLLLQSMYIFKQPKIGGEVVCHQDSTFLYTDPESAVGFWVALEDATIENGCLQVAKGGHKGPLRKIFTKENDKMVMKDLNNDHVVISNASCTTNCLSPVYYVVDKEFGISRDSQPKRISYEKRLSILIDLEEKIEEI